MQLHLVMSSPLPGPRALRPISPFALSAKVRATSASTPLMQMRSTRAYYTIKRVCGAIGAAMPPPSQLRDSS